MSRLSKEQVEQYLTIIGENSYPAEAAELRWHIEALDKYNYSQWERGYGDGITGMGAVLAGAPLENLPEANREQARRWIDRHDAELKAQTAAMLEKVCGDIKVALPHVSHVHGGTEVGYTCPSCYIAQTVYKAQKSVPTDYAAALNAMMVAAVDRGFQAGQKEMAERVREAKLEEAEWWNARRDVHNYDQIERLDKRIETLRAAALNAMMVAALDRGFQAGQKEMAGAPEREQP